MEGHYEAFAPADMYLFGWVNEEKEETSGLALPNGLSWLIHLDGDEEATGLDAFAEEDRPGAVNAVFQFYHLMVAIGIALILLSVTGAIYWKRRKLYETSWLLQLFAWSVILPQLANQFGWYTAEMGRQPWVVYGLLRTSDALSKAVTANQVWFSRPVHIYLYSAVPAVYLSAE